MTARIVNNPPVFDNRIKTFMRRVLLRFLLFMLNVYARSGFYLHIDDEPRHIYEHGQCITQRKPYQPPTEKERKELHAFFSKLFA